MNNIITLNKLTELLSQKTHESEAMCREFLTNFTALIGDTLSSDEIVKIKGLGTFKKVTREEKVRVEFIPDKEISDAINAPFAFFEPVEVSDKLTDERLNARPAVRPSFADIPRSAPEKPSSPSASQEDNKVTEDTYAHASQGAPQNELASADSTDEKAEAPMAAEVMPEIDEIAEDTPQAEEIPEDAELPAETAGTSESDDTTETPALTEDTPTIASAPVPEESHDTEDETPSTTAEDSTDAPASTPKMGEEISPQPFFVPISNEPDPEHEEHETKGNGTQSIPWFLIALFYVVGMLAGFCIGYFGHDFIQGKTSDLNVLDLTENEIETEDNTVPDSLIDLGEASEEVLSDQTAIEPDTTQTSTADSVQSAITATQPVAPSQTAAQEPKYDTLAPNSDLNSLSLKHYGRKEYWVYIYMDNADIIKNPNNLRAGTKLRIPPKEKYDVSATDEQKNIEAAKAKASQILRGL